MNSQAKDFIDSTDAMAKDLYDNAKDKTVGVKVNGLFTGGTKVVHANPESAKQAVLMATLRCDAYKRIAQQQLTDNSPKKKP